MTGGVCVEVVLRRKPSWVDLRFSKCISATVYFSKYHFSKKIISANPKFIFKNNKQACMSRS
jgi:hypothetical protein